MTLPRWRTVALVVLMIAWIVVVNLAGACTHPRPVAMPANEAAKIEAPWCVELVMEMDGVDVDWRLCASEQWACSNIAKMAKDQGQKVGVRSVGTCSETAK